MKEIFKNHITNDFKTFFMNYFLDILFISASLGAIYLKLIYFQFLNNFNERPVFSTSGTRMMLFNFSMLLIFIALITLLFRLKRFRTTLFALNFIISLILFSDTVYSNYYGTVLTVPVLYQFRLLGSIKGSVESLINIKSLCLFLDLPFILLFLYLFRRKMYIFTSGILKRIVISCLFLLISISIFFSLYQDSDSIIYDNNYVVANQGILYFHYIDVKRFISDNIFRDRDLTANETQQLNDFFSGRKSQKDSSAINYTGIGKGKNLIVIQVESMQQFLIGRKINGQEITPNLNKLANENLYFNNFYYETSGGNTSDAELLTNASLHPAKEGAAYFRYSTNTYDTIPKTLKSNGYNTYAMHAYVPTFWNRLEMYKAVGFDKFISGKDLVMDEFAGWGGWVLSDMSFFRQSLDKIDTSKPFYSFLITLSSHHPYDYFAKNSNLNAGEFENTYIGNYIKAENYSDKAIGYFIGLLKEKGLYDNSVIVIYGDHNGLPREQAKDLFRLTGAEDNDFEWTRLQKVPLIICCPGMSKQVVSTTGGQIDTWPTVANLMGIQDDLSIGKDLLNSKEGFAVLRNGSVITDQYIYLNGKDSLYGISDGKLLDKGLYMDKIKKYQQELNISDLILEKDAFANFNFK